MPTRHITGIIHNDFETFWPGVVVTFQHIAGAYTNVATYSIEITTVTADANGQISVDLASGLNVGWIYRIGDREQFRFNLPDGGPISLQQLRALSGTSQPTQTPLDVEAAARTAPDAALQAQISASGALVL